MEVLRTESRAIASEEDIVRIRQIVKAMAVESRLGMVDQTKVVTAASELVRNAYKYAGGGSARVEVVRDGRRRGVRLVVEDGGPGIPDLELALTDGYTTGGGLGLGLGGTRRLVDDFEIDSQAGAGTRVAVVKWT